MTTATQTRTLLTADDLSAMPDDGMRRELINGELIEMAPASDDHGFVGNELAWRISALISRLGLGRGRMAETGFQLTLDTVLAPDYAYISYERMAGRPQPRGYAQVVPDLVVEVFSPNDRQPPVDRKVRLWLDAGVRLVLVVYPVLQEMHAHHDDGAVRVFGIGDTLTLDPVLPGFACPVSDIFTY